VNFKIYVEVYTLIFDCVTQLQTITTNIFRQILCNLLVQMTLHVLQVKYIRR